jgi:hypothetical protein
MSSTTRSSFPALGMNNKGDTRVCMIVPKEYIRGRTFHCRLGPYIDYLTVREWRMRVKNGKLYHEW